MASTTTRKIQKSTHDVTERSQEGMGPPPGSRAGGGPRKHNIKKNEAMQGSRCCMNRKRTSLNVLASLFDMVAELAVAKRLIGLASLLA
eukprot:1935952-Amphidinium_carterae.1